MTTKFLAVISVIGLATICVVQGQSPSPAESPAASPSPAEKAASPSPAESPAASPKATPTPKKAKPKPTARPAVSPSPAARAIEEAANPPAPGGGHGQVWVNTETGVYHREGSRFYGTTKKGKYMTEREAILTGNRAARLGSATTQSNAIGYARFFQRFTRRRDSRLRCSQQRD
jgi:pyruvate/2-oxoglutarate dehydrogenase complex dihydrolipoamide acyltransferase (E2) component